jgi:REP element-mobilizing transposase RayT
MLVPNQMIRVRSSTRARIASAIRPLHSDASGSRPKRGGRRPGAGRKKLDPKAPTHAARAQLSPKDGVHVTLRCVRGVPRLRQDSMYRAIRRVMLRYLNNDLFRIVHISIQKNHLHLIIEAANKEALSRGMQSLAINLARAINRAWGRGGGKVFAYRYGAKQIRTKSYARNALSYVLNNWRRHREDFYNWNNPSKAMLDEYSSAVLFTGWTVKFGKPPPDYEPLPVSKPRTALLVSGWKDFGLIDPTERPGPLR